MPSDVLRAQFAALLSAAKEANDAAREIDGRLRQIDGDAEAIRGTWTGRAADAYLTVWDEISEECAGMLADLGWIGDSLSASADAFAAMDDANAEVLSALHPPTA